MDAVDAGAEVFADAGGDHLSHGHLSYTGRIQCRGVYGMGTSYANRASGVYGLDRGPGTYLLSHVSRSYGGEMIIEVTQILGAGSVRHPAVVTAVTRPGGKTSRNGPLLPTRRRTVLSRGRPSMTSAWAIKCARSGRRTWWGLCSSWSRPCWLKAGAI